MLRRFVFNVACDEDLADLNECLISICKVRPWGRPACLSDFGQVKVVLVTIHEVDEMMQMVNTDVRIDKPPYSAWHTDRNARLI